LVRFSRDRRGYEYVYLVDVPSRHDQSARPRVLYWYRTPPGLKVGRQAFDEGARTSLEGQYPDLSFDWKQIVETPMPPPDAVPMWRERRRQERSAKKARLDDEVEAAADEALAEPAEDPSAAENPKPAEEVAPVTAVPRSGQRRRRRRGGRGRNRPTDTGQET
jgi:hypothetical protein